MSGCGSLAAGNYATCAASTTYVPAVLTTDITNQGGTAVVFTSDANATTAYCASTKLNSGVYICVDSTGVTKSSATSICTVAISACPS
jgi:uncharacterized protein YceK